MLDSAWTRAVLIERTPERGQTEKEESCAVGFLLDVVNLLTTWQLTHSGHPSTVWKTNPTVISRHIQQHVPNNFEKKILLPVNTVYSSMYSLQLFSSALVSKDGADMNQGSSYYWHLHSTPERGPNHRALFTRLHARDEAIYSTCYSIISAAYSLPWHWGYTTDRGK